MELTKQLLKIPINTITKKQTRMLSFIGVGKKWNLEGTKEKNSHQSGINTGNGI